MSTLPADVLARRIEQIADRLEEQAKRHRVRASGGHSAGPPCKGCYNVGLADSKAGISERLRDALTAPEPAPADHHTPTPEAAAWHTRNRPAGDEWLVAHKDEPDRSEYEDGVA